MNSSTNETKSNGLAISKSGLIGWCVAYGTVDVLILIGNTVAIVIFTRSKFLRKRTNYFLLSLSVADMLVGSVSLPMYIHHLISWEDKNIWEHFRTTYLSLDIFTAFASIFALTIIALERLYSVALPNWHHTTKSYVYLILIAAIWILAGILASFRVLYSLHEKKLDIFFFVTTMSALFLSLLIICIAYIGIAIKVRMRFNEKTKKTIEKNRKLAVTLSIVTLIFVITWLPFYLLNVASRFCKDKCVMDFDIVFFSKFLQYCNSFINPIVYTFKIPEFRLALFRLVGRRDLGRSNTGLISLKDTRKRSSKMGNKNGNGNENDIFRRRAESNANDSI